MNREQRSNAARCYYCGRWLNKVAPLSLPKQQAFNKDMLTCGRCGTFGLGLPTWREGDRAHNNRRAEAKRRLMA